jgi:NADH-quinone oxidoreductase subunit I
MSFFPTGGALGVTFRNLFRKKVTEPLPWKSQRKRPVRFRSTFALVHNDEGEEACIGCKMCEKICPSDVISVMAGGRKESPVTGKKRGYCDDFTLDLNACIVCELCVQVCPTDAILMLSAPEEPSFGRESLVLTMDKLYENEKLDSNSWATGALLVEMQNPKRGLPKPEPVSPPAPTQKAERTAPEDEPTENAPLPNKPDTKGDPE